MTGNTSRPMILLLPLLCLVAAGDVHGRTDMPCIRPGDEIWLISARGKGPDDIPKVAELPCQSYCEGCWRSVDCSAIYNRQLDSNVRTVVFVHGFRTDFNSARQLGLEVYANLFLNRLDGCPIRFVVWAWRSEAESRRPLQDFSLKSRRAIQLGDTFAMTLNSLVSGPTTVIAYSLGTQIVISAAAQSNLYQGPQFQLAVIAAATDCGFSSCCQQLSSCGNVSCCWIFLNNGDRAIRAAKLACRLTHRRSYQTFEEFAPLHSDQLGQVNLVDITDVSSRKHSIAKYSELPVIRACVEQMLAESAHVNEMVDDFVDTATAAPTSDFLIGCKVDSPIRFCDRRVCTRR